MLDSIHYVLFRWGFIGCFRADNGHPFGTPTRQAFSPLYLHLQALGIRVHLNPVRSPKRNAKVERTQGTTCRWADPADCANYLELQLRLDEAVITQRELLPTRACKGKTRAENYPALFSNPKRFHPADFEMERVYRFLAKGRWERTVSSNGVTTQFGKVYQVGYPHKGKDVSVTFDPAQVSWVFSDQQGQQLAVLPASNICEANLRALSYAQ